MFSIVHFSLTTHSNPTANTEGDLIVFRIKSTHDITPSTPLN